MSFVQFLVCSINVFKKKCPFRWMQPTLEAYIVGETQVSGGGEGGVEPWARGAPNETFWLGLVWANMQLAADLSYP